MLIGSISLLIFFFSNHNIKVSRYLCCKIMQKLNPMYFPPANNSVAGPSVKNLKLLPVDLHDFHSCHGCCSPVTISLPSFLISKYLDDRNHKICLDLALCSFVS